MELGIDSLSKQLRSGLGRMLDRVAGRLKELHLIIKLFIQGLVLVVLLSLLQFYLESQRVGFMVYIPPIGFALFLVVTFLIQPIAIGALNIYLINVLYGTKGWQVGFWLNGVFLVLLYTTINLVLQTALNWSLGTTIAFTILLLALPFGCIARFSNGGWKKPIN